MISTGRRTWRRHPAVDVFADAPASACDGRRRIAPTGRASLFAGTTMDGMDNGGGGRVAWHRRRDDDRARVAGPVDAAPTATTRPGFAHPRHPSRQLASHRAVSAYTEDRGNGTPVQVNSTAWRQSRASRRHCRRWRWEAHIAGGSQDYYQTFSAVAAIAHRAADQEQTIPSDFFSAIGQWTRPLGRHTLLVGAEIASYGSTVERVPYTLVNRSQHATGPFLSVARSGTARFIRAGFRRQPTG